MNKKLMLLGALIIGLNLPCFAAQADNNMPPKQPPVHHQECDFKEHRHHHHGDFEQRKADFETKLNLTEEQKAKAKLIRENGRKEMEPVFNAMKMKRAEMDKLTSMKSLNNKQKAELEKIKTDLGELKNKAHQIKVKNMKEFESILTAEQIQTLNAMKDEGRKNFEARRHGHCDCGCGCEKCRCNKPEPKAGCEEKKVCPVEN